MEKIEFERKFKEANDTLDIDFFKEEIRKSSEDLGVKNRLVIAMEEAAEFSQAVAKMYRGKPDRMNLIEEMADMMICVESLKQIYHISDKEINKAINLKFDRGIKLSGQYNNWEE